MQHFDLPTTVKPGSEGEDLLIIAEYLTPGQVEMIEIWKDLDKLKVTLMMEDLIKWYFFASPTCKVLLYLRLPCVSASIWKSVCMRIHNSVCMWIHNK